MFGCNLCLFTLNLLWAIVSILQVISMPTDTAGTLVPVASHIFITAQGIYLILSIPLRPTMVQRYFASLSDELPKGFDNLIWRKIPLVYGSKWMRSAINVHVCSSFLFPTTRTWNSTNSAIEDQYSQCAYSGISWIWWNIPNIRQKMIKIHTDFQPADWQRRKAIVTDREGLWVRELSSVGAKTGF